MKVKVAQLSLTLGDPKEYTAHGILQARILEWVAFPFFRVSSQPKDQTQVFHIAGRFFTSRATREGWPVSLTPPKMCSHLQVFPDSSSGRTYVILNTQVLLRQLSVAFEPCTMSNSDVITPLASCRAALSWTPTLRSPNVSLFLSSCPANPQISDFH